MSQGNGPYSREAMETPPRKESIPSFASVGTAASPDSLGGVNMNALEDDTIYVYNEPSNCLGKRKGIDAIESFKMVSSAQEKLTIELVQGGFELIGVHLTDMCDGFFYPIRQMINSKSQDARKMNLLTVATRRKSPQIEKILFNERPPEARETKDNDDTSKNKKRRKEDYPRQHIVRMISRSDRGTRRNMLVEVANYLNKCNIQHPAKNVDLKDWQARYEEHPRYYVPEEYDLTPHVSQLRKLDYCLMPRDVVQIIANTHDGVGKSWAFHNPMAAALFFSPPYPEVAVKTLGYNNNSPYM